MFRHTSAPAQKDLVSGPQLRAILSRARGFSGYLDEIEVMFLNMLERATRLCPKNLKFNQCESNPAKNIVLGCGALLAQVGNLRVDWESAEKIDDIEKLLLKIQKEGAYIASMRKRALSYAGTRILTDVGVALVLLGRLRTAQAQQVCPPSERVPDCCEAPETECCDGACESCECGESCDCSPAPVPEPAAEEPATTEEPTEEPCEPACCDGACESCDCGESCNCSPAPEDPASD